MAGVGGVWWSFFFKKKITFLERDNPYIVHTVQYSLHYYLQFTENVREPATRGETLIKEIYALPLSRLGIYITRE